MKFTNNSETIIIFFAARLSLSKNLFEKYSENLIFNNEYFYNMERPCSDRSCW